MEATVAARRRHRELLLRQASAYDCELQEVVDKLFIGSIGGVLAPGVLEQNDVTHVLCVSTGVKEDVLRIKAPDASISVERLEDTSSDPQAFLQSLPALLGFIAVVIAEGHSILVCSFRGKSRAAAVVIAHLMLVCGSSLQEAVAHVAGVREGAIPNPGFIVALWALEAALTAECSWTELSEDEYSRKLLALVQVALSVLPGIIGSNPLPSSLSVADGRVLSLPEGLEDLSLKQLEDEAAAMQERLDITMNDSANDISVDLDAEGSPPSHCPSPEEIHQDEHEEDREASVAELEARKADAVARNDFDEACRLRDQIRALKNAGREAAPTNTENKVRPNRVELVARKKAAVEREDWSEAAKLRDIINSLGENEFENLGFESLNAARSSLEQQLAEAKRNLTKAFHEDVDEGPARTRKELDDTSHTRECTLEEEEDDALSCCRKCIMYPVASLSIFLMTLMCIHAGVLLVSSKSTRQEL